MVKLNIPYVKRQVRSRKNKRTSAVWERVYWYYRRPGAPDDGARIPGAPNTPEFMATLNVYNERAANLPAPPSPGSFSALVTRYRQSPEFTGLAEKTRRDYGRILRNLETKFGPLPFAGITREVIYALRDSMASKPAMANYTLRVMRLLLTWAHERGLIATNPAANPKQLKVAPRSAVWSEDAEAAFLRVAPPAMALALRLAINIAQRQGDILALTWNQYREGRIQLRQQKTGALVDVPCPAELRAVLDALPRVSTHILTDGRKRPFKADHFRHEWRAATLAAGLDGLEFRDLRRTAMVRMAEAGATDIEISAVSGHDIDQTRRILETYIPRTTAMATAAVAKLDAARDRKVNRKSAEVGNTN